MDNIIVTDNMILNVDHLLYMIPNGNHYTMGLSFPDDHPQLHGIRLQKEKDSTTYNKKVEWKEIHSQEIRIQVTKELGDDLINSIKKTKQHLRYMPGNSEFQNAKEHFDKTGKTF